MFISPAELTLRGPVVSVDLDLHCRAIHRGNEFRMKIVDWPN